MKKARKLKILPQYFEEVANGNKRAELRFNDRGFKVGDVYDLEEFDGKTYTGRAITIRITHILEGFEGLQKGWCMFSFITKGEEIKAYDEKKAVEESYIRGVKIGVEVGRQQAVECIHKEINRAVLTPAQILDDKKEFAGYKIKCELKNTPLNDILTLRYMGTRVIDYCPKVAYVKIKEGKNDE